MSGVILQDRDTFCGVLVFDPIPWTLSHVETSADLFTH